MKVYSTYSVKIKHYNKIFAETVAVYRSAVDYLINVVADEWDVVKDVAGSKAHMRCDRELIDSVIDVLNDVPNRDLKNTMVNSGLTQQALEYKDRTITEKMMVEHCERTKRFGEFLLSLLEDCEHII